MGLPVAALQVVQNPLKGLVQGALAPGLVVVEGQLFPLGAVEDDVHDLRRELFHRCIQPEVELLGQGVKVHPTDAVPADVVPPAGADSPVQNGQLLVGDDDIRVHLHLMPQPSTGGTGPVGVVEGERAGRQLFDGDTAVLTGVVLAEQQVFVLPHQVDDHNAAGELGGDLAAVRQPLGDVRTNDQPVYDDLNVVLDVLLQGNFLGQIKQIPIHPHPDITGTAGVLENLLVGALLPPDDRSQHLDASGFRQGQHLIYDLVNGLLLDLLPAVGTVGGAHPRPEQTEVIVNFRHRAYRGTRVFGGCFLVDGNGRRKAVNVIDIRLFHLPEEHTGIA